MTQLRDLVLKHTYKLLVITALCVMCVIILVTTYSHITPPITYLSPQEINSQNIKSWEQKIQDSERIRTYHKLSDQQKTLMLKNWLDHYHHQSLIISTAPLNKLLNTILKLQSSPYTQENEWDMLALEELTKPLPQIALSATLTQLNDILKRQHMAPPLQPPAQTNGLLKKNPLPTSIKTSIIKAFYRWKHVLSSRTLSFYEQACVTRISQSITDKQPKQPLWENPYLPIQDPTRFNALTKDMTKVLFIGTSQTWGAGASHPSSTFTNQLWQTCQRDIATPLLFLNMSQNGSNGPTLYHFYEQYWSQLNPDIVAINLSYNDIISGTSIDDNHSNFRHCLTQFVTFNNRHDIATLFILEAQEKLTDLELHATMKSLSKEYGIQLINLHSHIQNHKDNQALFWDNVHFTDRGHTLAAQLLKKPLTSLLTTITTNQLKALSPHAQDS